MRKTSQSQRPRSKHCSAHASRSQVCSINLLPDTSISVAMRLHSEQTHWHSVLQSCLSPAGGWACWFSSATQQRTTRVACLAKLNADRRSLVRPLALNSACPRVADLPAAVDVAHWWPCAEPPSFFCSSRCTSACGDGGPKNALLSRRGCGAIY